jgi:hypothetical protein
LLKLLVLNIDGVATESNQAEKIIYLFKIGVKNQFQTNDELFENQVKLLVFG